MNQEVFQEGQRVKFVGPPDDGLLGTVLRVEGDKLKVKPDDSSKKWNLRSKDSFTAAFVESITAAATTTTVFRKPAAGGKPKSEGTIAVPKDPPAKTTSKSKSEETKPIEDDHRIQQC